MLQIEKYELPEGIISCYINRDGSLCITGYEGTEERLYIPAQIGEYKVKAIGNKAFLDNRMLSRIILPDTIEEIGSWAFSRCRRLKEIALPRREIAFANRVFYKTEALREISVEGRGQTVAKLLAAAVTVLDAEYLVQPLQAGSDKWYQSLDARILTILKESEDSALKNLVYCAEEDMSEKQEIALKEQKYRKAEIAFLRLIHSDGIAPGMKQYLIEYLNQRVKGCMEETAWEVVKENRENQLLYCEKLFETGGINEGNINAVLDDLDENHIELKAYLLKQQQNQMRSVDLWNRLSLE